MVIKEKPHGFELKSAAAKAKKGDAAVAKRYPTMSPHERDTYLLALGAGRVMALLKFEKKERAEKKAKPAKKGKGK